MDLFEALRVVLPQTPWVAIAWLVVGTLRHMQAGALAREWFRPFLAQRWVRLMRKSGASDKEVRAFVREYALNGQGRSP